VVLPMNMMIGDRNRIVMFFWVKSCFHSCFCADEPAFVFVVLFLLMARVIRAPVRDVIE